MKDVVFCTNIPSPYRVDFFNEFGRYCNLTVVYERHYSTERNIAWKNNVVKNFKEVYLELHLVGVDRAKGSALKKYVKEHISDVLIFTNYVSPATMQAIMWCRLHKRRYYIEYDGGFNKKDSFFKGIIKKILLKGAVGHLTTAEEHIKYLKTLGISEKKIHKYSFTSVSEQDIIDANVLKLEGRPFYKRKLCITEEKIILTVGRFSYDNGYGKGYDILMRLAEYLSPSVGIYIVGDEPTKEFIDWKEEKKIEHVHFIGFKNKSELADYYAAADLFAILSRGDIWGLVVNEAMTYGLPIITSNRCIAGTELVKNGENGYVVDLDDFSIIKQRFTELILDDDKLEIFGKNSCIKIAKYTFTQMANDHINILWNNNVTKY